MGSISGPGTRLHPLAAILFAALLAPAAFAQPGADSDPAFGVGEPLVPAPFTLEQRFLEAARQGDRRTLELALAKGVAIDAKDELGRSALLLTVRDAQSPEAMALLRVKGAAIDVPDVGGRTAISWAAAAGRLDLVRQLAAWDAQVDRGDEDARTPLFYAAAENHRDVVAFLVTKGAKADVADRFGDTALMIACAKGHAEMAALLLEHGADPARKNQEGRTARDRSAPGIPICLDPRPE